MNVTKPKDIRVEMRVRNNLILSMMEKMGFKTIAELSRACDVSKSRLCGLVNMTMSPLTKKFEWCEDTKRLADFFKCLPEDLFSGTHVEHVLETNRAHAEVSFAEMQGLIANTQQHALLPEDIVANGELKELIASTLGTLSDREQRVLVMRFGIGGGDEHTHDEIAELFRVTRERIRQVEAKALRKLRHPSRREDLKEFA